MSASLQARRSSSQARLTHSSSLSTITRVWNDRLRSTANSSSRELVDTCDVIEVTPSPKRESRLHRASLLNPASNRFDAAATDGDTDGGLTDSPAAAVRLRASSVRCSVTRVLDSTRSLSSSRSTGGRQSLDVKGSLLEAQTKGQTAATTPRRSVDPNEEVVLTIAKPLFPNTLLTEVQDESRLLTLVLDLDETLVSNRDARQSEAVLRPYCLHVLNALRHMKELEIVLWTASTKETASPVVEQLHQTGIIFDDVIYRNNVWFTQPIHTKNLKLLGRDMDRVLIVDNSVGCCKMHPRNSLLVEDFHGARRRTDAALVNVYYVVDALLRMLRERGTPVCEGLRCLMAEGQLCHTVSYELPEFFKSIPLAEVPELKRPPIGRFVRANTAPPNTSIMQHWVY
ncbi:hypothetical protein ABB37_05564 [Leptomonas pyrrhocoris]|uniref:Mitochondrial import inner membrane translocase subunit TIM50 n=1 Tax=Leptomonas pyrrhocoris TaxID=157538 RepID=A0A0M9FZF9_LEPPY|nr:hypothetical protein ABB37_05564 [Leptomonas pyrrhocoris]KPA79026.1 hypothetical protein ABB37_05564 [Leptomonas pyrrhocoris]|eukprot:XP_015657465.1 hypothetical protein ABB37_05564 [Leptomonas pyrrhocoris]